MRGPDLQPTLTGELVELRPLRPDDWNELFAVASDPLIWEQHPASDRYKEEVFRVFFQEALASRGAFGVFERRQGRIIGSTRFYGYDRDKSEVEIGWTFLGRQYWGGAHNQEMKRMLLRHAFQFVGRVVFYVGENNIRSRRAVEKIGGVPEAIIERPSSGGIMRNVRYVIHREGWPVPGEPIVLR